MADQYILKESLDLQTLLFNGHEWMKISDVIEWVKRNEETGAIPTDVSHMLIKALVIMKNTKV